MGVSWSLFLMWKSKTKKKNRKIVYRLIRCLVQQKKELFFSVPAVVSSTRVTTTIHYELYIQNSYIIVYNNIIHMMGTAADVAHRSDVYYYGTFRAFIPYIIHYYMVQEIKNNVHKTHRKRCKMHYLFETYTCTPQFYLLKLVRKCIKTDSSPLVCWYNTTCIVLYTCTRRFSHSRRMFVGSTIIL